MSKLHFFTIPYANALMRFLLYIYIYIYGDLLSKDGYLLFTDLVICMIKMSVCVLCTRWWGGVGWRVRCPSWVCLYIVLSLSIEMGKRKRVPQLTVLQFEFFFFWLLNYYSLRFDLSVCSYYWHNYNLCCC